MKKILSLVLVAILCLSTLVGCGLFGNEEDLNKAGVLLHNIYKDKNESTTTDFDVVAQVIVDGVKFPVTWTCDNDKITIRESTKEGFYTVDLPDVNTEEFTYTLTATISGKMGKTVERSYTFKMLVLDNSAVVTEPVEGVAYKLFLTQNNLGKRFYATAGQSLGSGAGASKGKYIKTTSVPQDGVEFFVEKVDGGYKFYTVVNDVKNYVVAEYFAESEGKNPSKYIGYSTEDGSVFTYNNEMGGVWTVTIEGTVFGVGTYSTFETICISEGKFFTPSAIGSSQFVLQIVTAEYANSLEEDVVVNYDSAEDLVNAAYALGANESLGQRTLTGKIISIDTPYDEGYGNVTVSIVVGNLTDKPIQCFRLKGTGADKIAVGDEITVTGVLKNYTSYEDDGVTVKTSKVEFDSGCTLDKWSSGSSEGGETPSTGVVDPVAGTAYKFGMVQGNLNATYYLAGGMDSYYMATTTDASAAIDVYLEETEGGYYLYTLDGESKLYINMVVSADGAHVNGAYEAAASTVYTYNTESQTVIAIVNETEYWFGTRNDKSYTTVGPCAVSYAGFYCQFYGEAEGGEGGETPVVPETPAVSVVDPVVGTAYKFGMVQQNVGTDVYYLIGGMDGYYMATGTDASAAIDVYLEETEGGYYLYTLDGESKLYINMVVSADGAHVNGAYEAAASTVYTYNTESQTVIAIVNETEYWFGTRNDKSYTTVGPCAVSYAGFYCQFYGEAEGGEGGETPVDPEPEVCEHSWVDATCSAPKTCSLCQATEGEALAHIDNEGADYKCDVCSAVVEPTADSTLTLAQANTLGALYEKSKYTSNKYWIEGVVEEIDSNGTMTIKDAEGNSFYIYKSNGADGTYYNQLTIKHVVGDTVKVYGAIGKYSDPQMQYGLTTVISHTHAYGEATCAAPATCACGATEGEATTNHTWTDATCTAPKTCSVCDATDGEALGHTTEEGTCERCGKNIDPNATTVSVSIADYATANSWVNATLYANISLDSNITVASSGTPASDYGLNTGKYYESGNTWRIYQNETPSVTITAAEGKTIVSVKITYSVKNSGTLTLNGEAVASDTVVAVNANSITFSVGNTGTKTNGQAQITAIEVIYQ